MAATSIKGENAANSGVNGMFGEFAPVLSSPLTNAVPLLGLLSRPAVAAVSVVWKYSV